MQFLGQQAEDKSHLCHHTNCPRFSKDYLIINYGENKIPDFSETETAFLRRVTHCGYRSIDTVMRFLTLAL